MTPDGIIALARTQFGEETALMFSAAQFQTWFNAALKEAYNDLPDVAMRRVVSHTPTGLTAGEAPIPDTWDRIHGAEIGGAALIPVDPGTIRIIDSNPYMDPIVAVFSTYGKTLSVRPTSITSVDVVHQEAPEDIVFPAGGLVELADVDERWHPALAHLITSYAYQTEEDHTAAAHWRGRYAALVGQADPPPPAVPAPDQE